MSFESLKRGLDALVGVGRFKPQDRVTAKKWALAGEVGGTRKEILANMKALTSDEPPRTGRIQKTQFYLSHEPGKQQNILNVLKSQEGAEELRRAVANASVHHDGQGNYRITLYREEGPLANDVEEITNWWKREHLKN